MSDVLVYLTFIFIVAMSLFLWAWRQESKRK